MLGCNAWWVGMRMGPVEGPRLVLLIIIGLGITVLWRLIHRASFENRQWVMVVPAVLGAVLRPDDRLPSALGLHGGLWSWALPGVLAALCGIVFLRRRRVVRGLLTGLIWQVAFVASVYCWALFKIAEPVR